MRSEFRVAAIIAVLLPLISVNALADVGPQEPAPQKTYQAPAPEPVSEPQSQVTTYSSSVTTTYESTGSEYNIGDKLARGLANVLASPLEVPLNVQNVTEDQGVLVGWTGGLAQGIGMTALRIIVGAYEIITFPIPFPEGYKPVIQPEYVWQTPGPKITPQGETRER
jgi:putative exosortase-associated protein (TIGR04073 family)